MVPAAPAGVVVGIGRGIGVRRCGAGMPRQGRYQVIALHRLTQGATLVLAAATAAALLAGHGLWFDLANHLLLQIAYATLAALAATVLLRRWRWAGMAGLLLAMQAAVLLPAAAWPALGAAARAHESAVPLRVAGFNLWVRNPDIDASLDFLRREAADVVVLSEVTPAWAAALDRLADLYPQRVDCVGEGRCRLVLLSRLPWHDARAWQDPGGIPLVQARVEVGRTAVTVVGTHLTRPFPRFEHDGQQGQAAFVAAHLAALSGPRVLIGDFNAASWSPVLRRLAERSGLTILPGLAGTWPAYVPAILRIPIDQILVSPELSAPPRRVGPGTGSDHRPVIADLEVPQG